MFRVNNKDTRTTPEPQAPERYQNDTRETPTTFVNFEQVNVGSGITLQ